MVLGWLQSLARLLALSCIIIIMRSPPHHKHCLANMRLTWRSVWGEGGGKVNFCSGGWKMLPLGSAVWTRGGGVPSSPSPRPPAAPSSWWPPPSTACPGCSRTVVGARWTRSCCGGFASPPLLASSRPHTRWHATAATHTGWLRPPASAGSSQAAPLPLQVPPLRPPHPALKPPLPLEAPSPTEEPHRTQQPHRPQQCTNPPTPSRCTNVTNVMISTALTPRCIARMKTANVTIPSKSNRPNQCYGRIT